jgi:hypothetical protein
MTSGIDANSDDMADAPGPARDVLLEGNRAIELEFPPGKTIVFDFALAKSGAPVAERADLAIGPKDVRFEKGALLVTVHNLGAAEGSGTLRVENAGGSVLAEAPIPALAAPADLLPKTTEIRLALPAGTKGEALRVRLAAGAAEITELNNLVETPRP